MKTVRITVDPSCAKTITGGRIDAARVDATTEAELARQAAADDAQALQDAAKVVRRVRKRLGLTQAEFSERIDVPLETVRNWEQGRRAPTGAARALLKVLGNAPEVALRWLNLRLERLKPLDSILSRLLARIAGTRQLLNCKT